MKNYLKCSNITDMHTLELQLNINIPTLEKGGGGGGSRMKISFGEPFASTFFQEGAERVLTVSQK